MDYSKLSKDLTSQLTKEEKKENGIYFTPQSCIHKNISLLQPYLLSSKKLLEPSCGSCEYILTIHKYFEKAFYIEPKPVLKKRLFTTVLI